MTKRAPTAMSRSVLVLFLVLGGHLVSAASPGQPSLPGGLPADIVPVPTSLNELYPPTAKQPVLLVNMHGLNSALAGMVVDLSEGDGEGALKNFRDFEVRYREAAQLVPEWASCYPTEPVQKLGKAMAGGNPKDVMDAVTEVGHVCHQCHVATMVPVQQRYRWPDFGPISVHDPILGAELDYPSFMQMLNANLVGVGMDLGQGQLGNGQAQLTAFRSRMLVLRETCNACHDTERKYYVDDQIMQMLTEMEAALDAAKPDAAVISQISRRIGEESCSRCHLVHLPAAYSGPKP